MRTNQKAIGVFDSGLGGLTVVREIRKQLPSEKVVYFGDIARLPYGIRSNRQIQQYSIQNIAFLKKHSVKALVIACNSSASAALSVIRKNTVLPVIDVIEPAVEAALKVTREGRIGVIATQATIESGAYQKLLRRFGQKSKVFFDACPLFVPLVESGWLQNKITREIAEKYLSRMKRYRIDTLILGCTHYPMLSGVIRQVMGERVKIVDSAKPTVSKLASLLEKNGLCYPRKRKAKLTVCVSDLPRDFKRIGERFLGEKIPNIRRVVI